LRILSAIAAAVATIHINSRRGDFDDAPIPLHRDRVTCSVIFNLAVTCIAE